MRMTLHPAKQRAPRKKERNISRLLLLMSNQAVPKGTEEIVRRLFFFFGIDLFIAVYATIVGEKKRATAHNIRIYHILFVIQRRPRCYQFSWLLLLCDASLHICNNKLSSIYYAALFRGEKYRLICDAIGYIALFNMCSNSISKTVFDSVDQVWP